MTSEQPPPRVYWSAGERYLATAIPGLFNLTVGFLKLEEFARFAYVYQTNAKCYEHWPQLVQVVHRAEPHLFSVFESKAALRWVLMKGINARHWNLCLDSSVPIFYSFLKVCKDGDLDIVRAMVERTQVKLEARDEDGWTPLHHAAFNDHLSVVQCLCEQRADKDARDQGGDTPLHLAAQNGNISVVKYMCEQGAHKEKRNRIGKTPLHLAVSRGHISMVQYLCEQGADSEAMDNMNSTLLHLASFYGHISVLSTQKPGWHRGLVLLVVGCIKGDYLSKRQSGSSVHNE